jgi:hypothetical protein
MAFWNCPDPFVQALKTLGYNIVRLPKADILPLQLLYKNGNDLERLGDATKLLTAGESISVPQVKRNTAVANINGVRSGDVKIGLGISLLGTIIGAMGGSSLGLETQYNSARTASFEFLDVLEDSIEIIDLDMYLGDADINPAGIYAGKLLEADKLFITTSVLKSAKISFEAKDRSGIGVGVDVPAIQGVVSGSVKVSSEVNSSTKITYEGKIPLVFGFQAVQLYYDNAAYTAIKPVMSTAMRSILETEILTNGAELLLTEDTFINLPDL